LKARGLMARYRAARRARWWLRDAGVEISRLYFDEGGDPTGVDVPSKDPA
jgi:hypothetical protein